MPLPEIIIGDVKFPTSRLRRGGDGVAFRVSGNRRRMILYLVSPAQKIHIEGEKNVIAAIQEIELVFSDDDEKGWQ